MKLVHDKFGQTYADSEQEARRLAQYGWRKAPEKPSRKRKPVEESAPELPVAEDPKTDSE